MFVKNIITGSIIIPETLRISLFKPQGLRKLIESVPSENYILGVGYEEGDYQICISGRKKRGEPLTEALRRETFEELALSLNKEPVLELKSGRNYFYKININETEIKNPSFPTSTEFDTKERVIACVYGTEKDILDYLENVHLDIYNCDNITHIWTDKAENLLKYVKM